MTDSIYGAWEGALREIMERMTERLSEFNSRTAQETGYKVYEHLNSRVKSEDSMREKCRRKDLPETAQSALTEIRDAVGLRIVCNFIDDIYRNVEYIRSFPDVTVIEEKDYVYNAKPNGYRSYHMILSVEHPTADPSGNTPGRYFVEIQLRTIAMDTWASLEHEMKYKREVSNQRMIVSELKRVADELASCDVSMQTLRDLIREGSE